jgi:hypothetical protein
MSRAGSTSIAACACPQGSTLINIGGGDKCLSTDQVNKYSMKDYNPSSQNQYNNGPITSLLLVKNTIMCPPNSMDPCCSDDSAANKECVKNGFWGPSQVFDKNVAGFQDYPVVSNQGMYLLNKKRAKINSRFF